MLFHGQHIIIKRQSLKRLSSSSKCRFQFQNISFTAFDNKKPLPSHVPSSFPLIFLSFIRSSPCPPPLPNHHVPCCDPPPSAERQVRSPNDMGDRWRRTATAATRATASVYTGSVCVHARSVRIHALHVGLTLGFPHQMDKKTNTTHITTNTASIDCP